ncbi:hypothetical protein DP939_40455 [Spongiactinospora rosea]|uniref:Uncharacterized protein n=1 Tax=Spongiactinospora rosea TaxID=2248750 RepID=A0A366LM03_9ACTN|nr:hypothetical protein DP939_40455 [Spongiactinospora rosea]
MTAWERGSGTASAPCAPPGSRTGPAAGWPGAPRAGPGRWAWPARPAAGGRPMSSNRPRPPRRR